MSEHTPLSPERLAEIARMQLGDWYAGPWTQDPAGVTGVCRVYHEESDTVLAELPDWAGSIALWMADAHDALPALLAEVERRGSELAKYTAEPTVAEEMAFLGRCIDAVLDLCDRAEQGAARWEQPLPVPEWVAPVRAAATGERGGNTVVALHQRIAELERADDEVMAERDALHDRLDEMAAAVAPIEEIGEHSSHNDPWANALDLITPAAEVERLRGEMAARPTRADVLREVQDATVAWLERKAAEERGVARQEEERRATARARAHRERADLISTLASKAARGAIREFLAATPPQPTPAEVLADAADRIAARAAQLGGEWLRVDQVCDALRRLGTDRAPSPDTTEAGEGR